MENVDVLMIKTIIELTMAIGGIAILFTGIFTYERYRLKYEG